MIGSAWHILLSDANWAFPWQVAVVYDVCHPVWGGVVYFGHLVPGIHQHATSAIGAPISATIPCRTGFHVIEPGHG
jgi:hypothetical protein